MSAPHCNAGKPCRVVLSKPGLVPSGWGGEVGDGGVVGTD